VNPFGSGGSEPVREDGNILIGIGIFLTLAIVTFVLHNLIVRPCGVTTNWHSVTTSVGTYSTKYIDNSEWCLWIRS
jgi:hypothetical protein